MGLTPQAVARLGELARIRLSEQECQELAPELDVILDSVQAVGEVATPDVPMTTHAIGLTNVFRDDEVRSSLTREQALSGAPATEQERFRVPQILSEEA